MANTNCHNCLSPRKLLRGKQNERLVVSIPARYEDRKRCREIVQSDTGNLVAAFYNEVWSAKGSL